VTSYSKIDRAATAALRDIVLFNWKDDHLEMPVSAPPTQQIQ